MMLPIHAVVKHASIPSFLPFQSASLENSTAPIAQPTNNKITSVSQYGFDQQWVKEQLTVIHTDDDTNEIAPVRQSHSSEIVLVGVDQGHHTYLEQPELALASYQAQHRLSAGLVKGCVMWVIRAKSYLDRSHTGR